MSDDSGRMVVATSPTATEHDDLVSRLTRLADNPDLDAAQRELAEAWRERLEGLRERVMATLSAAFIAQVGRGKSTLVAAVTGLRLDEGADYPEKWSVLPVGPGRTTLGETRIEFGARDDLRLTVEPVTEDELRTEIRILARDHWSASRGLAKASMSAGEEMQRLLRQWLVPDATNPRDALTQAAKGSPDAESFEKDLLSRIELDGRVRPYEAVFAGDEAGRKGLQQTLKALMAGKLAEAPAPRVVHIHVPSNDLGGHIQAVIDTRGIDPVAPDAVLQGRKDLHELLADPDVLLVLCSEFEAAPDIVSVGVLTLLQQLVGSAAARERSVRLVVVDRRALADDDPERAEQQRQDSDERVAQCEERLCDPQGVLSQGAITVIDARRRSDELRRVLVNMAVDARRRREQTWAQGLVDAGQMLATLRDVEFAVEARKMDLRLWWVWDAALAEGEVSAKDGLAALADVIAARDPQDIKHWSHIHAAVRRRGRYYQLDLATIGARHAATLAASPYLAGLAAVRELVADAVAPIDTHRNHLNLRLEQFERIVRSHVAQLTAAWHERLSAYFTAENSDDLWGSCEARWGGGSGYVADIARRFREEAAKASLKLTGKWDHTAVEDRLPTRPELFALRRIRLQNFRCVEERTIDLPEKTMVLVGDNGLGKTSCLEAIVVAVGALLPGMDAGAAPILVPRDVRQVIRERGGVADKQPQLPLEIYAEATLQGQPLKWTRSVVALMEEHSVADDDALQEVAREIGAKIREHSAQQLPVLAYYGTQRLWPVDLEPVPEGREVGSRFDGYRDSLTAASTHRHMLEWVRQYTLVEWQRKRPQPQLRAIERAVVACVEGARHFRYDAALKDLILVMENGEVVPFWMLSDGYRNVVAMVADIAWRASVLNPQLGERAPGLAEGIVLIDEIDLHLHPKWQRRVLSDLQRAFPRMQFIVTSHSPFIIQSLRPGQLVNLDPDAEDVPYADESPEDIAEHIMGVEVPQRSERRRREFEAAKRYYELLDKVPHVDADALELVKAELDAIVAPYADNQAFVAFLARKRMLAEGARR